MRKARQIDDRRRAVRRRRLVAKHRRWVRARPQRIAAALARFRRVLRDAERCRDVLTFGPCIASDFRPFPPYYVRTRSTGDFP